MRITDPDVWLLRKVESILQISGLMTNWGEGGGFRRLISLIPPSYLSWSQKGRIEPSGILETLFTFWTRQRNIYL